MLQEKEKKPKFLHLLTAQGSVRPGTSAEHLHIRTPCRINIGLFVFNFRTMPYGIHKMHNIFETISQNYSVFLVHMHNLISVF